MLDYGIRVGAWRLLDLLYELALPASVVVDSAVLEDRPELPRAHLMRGDEIVGHARARSERGETLAETEAATLIRETTAALTRTIGAKPQGWFGAGVSAGERTLDLVQEAGYAYLLGWCGDDQPVWVETRAGRILAVPSPHELDDLQAAVGRMVGAAAFADMLVDDFDERLRQSESAPLVMGVALHPSIAGQPHRLNHLRRALRHVLAQKDRLWVATAGAIAAHAGPHAP